MTAYLNRARCGLKTFSLVLCLSAALPGCKSGGGGDASSSAPATTVPVTTTPATSPTTPSTNKAPTIAGTANATLTVNTPYSFSPAANDADGDHLTFQIQNKPSWATFSTVTGQLSGTPTSSGAHSNIVISVSDGHASAALPAFAIAVTMPQAQMGSATLSWAAPTQNTDGSVLNNLAGFIIAYGPSSSTLTQTVKIENASVDTYVFDQLPSGTYHFAVKAYTSSGAESQLSSTVSKVIG